MYNFKIVKLWKAVYETADIKYNSVGDMVIKILESS
jgi:hypothetical protein